VICEAEKYGPLVQRYLDEHGPLDHLHFSYVAKAQWHGRFSRIPGCGPLAYYLWQRGAFELAKRMHAERPFDLVHQVTFCGYREPGYGGELGVPFIWGPIGGTQNYPYRYLPLAGLSGALREGSRSLLNSLQFRFSPRVRRAAKQAAALLVANSTIDRDMRRALGMSPQLQLETGVRSYEAARRTPHNGPLRILWSGELQPWKAMPLLLHALAKLPANVAYEVRILGEGPLERSWRRLAQRLGVGDRLQWLGHLPHAEALALFQWADVLAFTSLRDTSGNVVLEALAAGVPVVCLDHQGVRDMVTSECGIRVPVEFPRATIASLADALTSLATQPELRERLSAGALERAAYYNWDRQGERMARVYAEALQRSGKLAAQPTELAHIG
jgi:glycosyltransferase involved in cell wall biosynthesis